MNELVIRGESITDSEWLQFLGMDENRVKLAFRQWLYELASRRNYLNDDGDVIMSRLAEDFHVSRQVVKNWLSLTATVSTKIVSETLCPALNLTVSEFWAQMQAVDQELRGVINLTEEQYHAFFDANGRARVTARDVMDSVQLLSTEEKARFRQIFFEEMAKSESCLVK